MNRAARGPVHVEGEVLGAKKVGVYRQLTLVAPGVADTFRPGNFLSVSVGDELSERLLTRALFIHRVRTSSAYGASVEVAFAPQDPGTAWLAGLGVGARLRVTGPLGRPFALPKEPVACTLVGDGVDSAPLFALAGRLRERGCAVHMLLGAATESRLFGVLDAQRTAKTVVVTTGDGSVGIRGRTVDVLPELLARTDTDVVYACGPAPMLHRVAAAAEAHGAWSQTAVSTDLPCGTGLCLSCTLPVVGEDGVTRMVRTCTEGPVFRGDRVRWGDVGTVPADAWGAAQRGGPR